MTQQPRESRRCWTIARPPAGGFDEIDLEIEAITVGQLLYRVQPKGKAEAFHFSHNPDNRLSSEHDPPRHRECYAALESDVAVHETVFWNPCERDFFEDELDQLEVTQFTPKHTLEALHLDEGACSALGIDISIFTTRDIGLSRAWASALHEWRGGRIDALIFPTRTGGREAVTLFERAEPKLSSLADRTPLLQWHNRRGKTVRAIVERRRNGYWHPK